MDHQLRDLPPVGEEHRERLRSRSQLDLQRPGVAHFPPPGSVLHLLWSVSGQSPSELLFFIYVKDREGDKVGELYNDFLFFINPVKLN